MYKHFYIGDYNQKREIDVNTRIILEDKRTNNSIYECTTIKGLFEIINQKDLEIMQLCDFIESIGYKVCPSCGEIQSIEDMTWDDFSTEAICNLCYEDKYGLESN